MSYVSRRLARSASLELRGLRFQLYRWPGGDPQPALLLHGWGDTGQTWQFLIDHLSPARTWVAVDLRGFGRTQRPQDGYWFPDYLADLDALIDALSPQAPIDLVGHSMGANIASLYAGVRPDRVRRLVSLEGAGMPPTTADQAPARYAQWLDEIKNGTRFATYDSYEQLVRVLAVRNPRTPREHLEFIARSWAHERADGRVELWADPRHKRVNPVLYQHDQAHACWRSISAPVLFVTGDESDLVRRMGEQLAEDHLHTLFARLTIVRLAGAGHMMHHERPGELACIIERFFDANA
jgi:pimeloyl-ACP methyl ester carboxylesterase